MKKILLALFVSFFALGAFAQSADKITEVIESNEITYEQGAWLCHSFAEENGEQASYSEAMEAAVRKGWISSGAVAQNPMALKELCGLCVKASGLKGGLFYRISKADRYAFKELKSNGILDSYSDPSMKVSGQNAVAILNGCIKKAGGSK